MQGTRPDTRVGGMPHAASRCYSVRMFVELVDLLRCPHAHEDSWLVAAADETADRHIVHGSLGCPEPGRMYTQALIPGYLIRVQADATVLEYHANARGQWLYCPAERAVAPLPDPSK